MKIKIGVAVHVYDINDLIVTMATLGIAKNHKMGYCRKLVNKDRIMKFGIYMAIPKVNKLAVMI